jgi:predicted phosphodiesterase
MGGDSISGSIHEELAETNDLSSIPAIRDYCAHIRWGIEKLKEALGCKIVVVRVPGNHDRTSKKPRHKGYVETSFDTIISWHLEMCFSGDGDVTFLIPPENDAVFDIYGYKFLMTHGDMMGTGGGQGYIGAVAPITKGHRKLVETYMQAGKPVDYVLTGHFHTAVETEYGWGNGSLPGFSEYARLKLRAKPSPPVQWLLHVHPERGVTTRRQIMVAAQGEGDLYDPKVKS